MISLFRTVLNLAETTLKLLKLQKKPSFCLKNAKISCYWKKLQKFQSFCKKLHKFQVFSKNCRNLKVLTIFFVVSDVIEKLYIRVEFKNKLKLYFNWYHVETVI